MQHVQPQGVKPRHQQFAQQRIEEGRLARVKLAHHNKQKELVELVEAALEQIQILLRRLQTRKLDADVVKQ